ncbi:bacillithiol biosynthesis cysteine-adding enzyme BshC [Gynurincola endophyticus]|uniref:bacillithiol biosynthesis cysteine-adding enzyme BshC n=1 Tax=Gynurincola endophyticus TaxID=2479004 RepID=UPI000F8CB540|nr:bacillithiol biosynthesis cysteine-adding enzyme BshC [Gynurincola endophyticus]
MDEFMMNTSINNVSLESTGYFSKLMLDYVQSHPSVSGLYDYPMNEEGLLNALKNKQQQTINRNVLAEVLKEQYQLLSTTDLVQQNIDALLEENTFTICTAHQPSLFTGNLYFIYKIAQTISLAKSMSAKYPEYRFVPVFWMGSEDADLDELGYVYLNGETLRWDTKQTGAVGRMSNKGIDTLIQRLENELSVQSYGNELIDLLKRCYRPDENFQQATFRLINELFQQWGVVVLIPDHPALKKEMQQIFEDDLTTQQPSEIVAKTIAQIPSQYKIQANPRSVNLFYLTEGIRNLIVFENNLYWVKGTELQFTQAALLEELHTHPERFSPNVILRGLFQEKILPNIATIGGGGETAYWLELKDLFKHYEIPYPVLVLRNSFLWMDTDQVKIQQKYNISNEEMFLPTQQLYAALTKKQTDKDFSTQKEWDEMNAIYQRLKEKAAQIDKSLVQHISALQVNAERKLNTLEKKLFKSERQSFEQLNRQVEKWKKELFPKNGLQERVENFLPFYAKYGKEFIEIIVEKSPALSNEFIIIKEEVV